MKQIETQTEYSEAIQEVETLMDAEPNTSEGDRLDELATRIVEYETKHYQW